ncbi:MAG: rod shape-determining protein MreC [Parcubacteria group bacterium]|nr:rod shape-determining protein MreC [Parcubacteria group bacterium]
MKRRGRAISLIVSGALLSALLFFLWVRGGTHAIRGFGGSFVGAFRTIGRVLQGVPTFFSSRHALEEENERIRKTLEQLSFEYAELETLRREHRELTHILGYTGEHATRGVLARITGTARDPFTKSLFIDRGRTHGVREGAAVLAGNGIFIGKVIRIWDESAEILLALDTRSRVPATVVGRDGALGVLEGHEAVYRLTLVPRDSVTSQDDLVVTASLAPVPAGLVVGTIQTVETDPDAPFQTIVVLPLFSPGELSFVTVLGVE